MPAALGLLLVAVPLVGVVLRVDLARLPELVTSDASRAALGLSLRLDDSLSSDPARLLELEITESALAERTEEARAVLVRLRELGLRIGAHVYFIAICRCKDIESRQP